MFSKNRTKVSLRLIEDTNKASNPCCHLDCDHKKQEFPSATAAQNNDNEIVIAESEKNVVVEVEE